MSKVGSPLFLWNGVNGWSGPLVGFRRQDVEKGTFVFPVTQIN